MMNELLLEKAAITFRSDCGINNKDSIRLKSLLQKLNVITSFSSLSDQFSGMALKTGSGENTSRFILINSDQSMGKQHFTICHELYHLFVQPNFVSQVCQTGLFDKSRDREEYNADVFASFLLLPTDGILELIPDEQLSKKKITLQTIVYLEQYYSCSRRALLYRLKKMNLLAPGLYESYTQNIQRSAIENGYNTDLYQPGNSNVVIGNYGALAKNLFDKEKISESKYYSLLRDLGINVSDIDQLTAVDT